MALLKGKTAVITGGTAGIGLATAKRFVEEGAYVFITGRRQAELEAAVKELGDNVTGVQGDVSKAEDLDRLYAAVADSGRRLDVVFANAAILEVARIGDITDEQLDYQLGVDLKGVVFTVQKALPLLNDGGSIILNASNVAASGATASGCTRRSRLRSDRSPAHGQVSCGTERFASTPSAPVRPTPRDRHPGPHAVPWTERGAAVRGLPAQHRAVGALRHADEVANAVLFLASDLSSFTTGADIPVDGGINQI